MRLDKSLWVTRTDRPRWKNRSCAPLLWIGAAFLVMAMIAVVHVAAAIDRSMTDDTPTDPDVFTSMPDPSVLRTPPPARSAPREPLTPPSDLRPPSQEPTVVPADPPPVEVRQVSIPAGLALIRANESGGDYQAVNPTGCGGYGCGGAYQLHRGYADDWAIRYGYGEWADVPPEQWPPAVQDGVARGLYEATNGRAWCDFTTYC